MEHSGEACVFARELDWCEARESGAKCSGREVQGGAIELAGWRFGLLPDTMIPSMYQYLQEEESTQHCLNDLELGTSWSKSYSAQNNKEFGDIN